MSKTKPKVHEIVCWPDFWGPLMSGAKSFEVRRDDRGYSVGDHVVVRKLQHNKRGAAVDNSARPIFLTISYKLAGGQFGVEAGYCVLGYRSGFR